MAPYETKVTLVSGVESIITREFAQTSDLASGEILSFDQIAADAASLSVISSPESAKVLIDGSVKGIAPYKSSEITLGDHLLSLEAEGYRSRSIDISILKGYKLTAIIDLAVDLTAVKEELEVEEEEEVELIPMVKILETGVGFLRVRAEPSTLGKEVGRVEPGDELNLINTDEKTGWFKIGYGEGEEGWISNTYAEEVLGDSKSATESAEKEDSSSSLEE